MNIRYPIYEGVYRILTENRTDPVPILCMYEYQSSTTGYDGNEKSYRPDAGDVRHNFCI